MNKKVFVFIGLVALSTSAVGCKPGGGSNHEAALRDSSTSQSDTAMNSSAVDSSNTEDGDSLIIKDITAEINFGYRKADRGRGDIDIIVVHSNYHVVSQSEQIFDFDVQGCINQFRDGGTAAHYLIARDGTVMKMVDEKNIAWHAGRSALPDGSRKMLNASSIGIEVISMKRDGPTDAQYRALDSLIKDICSRYDIRYLVRHSDIATPLGRKDDPWGMDWQRVTENVKAKYPNVTTFDIPVKDNPQFK